MFGGDDDDDNPSDDNTMMIAGIVVVVVILGALVYWYFYMGGYATISGLMNNATGTVPADSTGAAGLANGPADTTTGLPTGAGSNVWMDPSGKPYISFITGKPMPILSGPPIVYSPDPPVDTTMGTADNRKEPYLLIKGVPQYNSISLSNPERILANDRNLLRNLNFDKDPRFAYVGTYNNTYKCHDAIVSSHPEFQPASRIHLFPHLSEFKPSMADRCYVVKDPATFR